MRLVLDVVYNHVADASSSAFEQLVPGYYFRHRANGSFSDGSGCGNEVASDRPMVRKLIVESVAYWASMYRVDGFRFDLMGLLDLETMKQVRTALDQIDPTIFVYGEGWAAGGSPYPDKLRAIKANTGTLTGIAAFGDELRDGVKGHYSRHTETGFAGGRPGSEESVKFGIVAATQHPQVVYSKVNASKAPWATAPAQCINYVACHDDMVLWDKIAASTPGLSEPERVQIDVLSNTIVFTAQGVPFLPVGDEFLRTKKGISNSYNKPDSINQLDYGLKAKNKAVFAFYKKLIALRKAHPAFRLPTVEAIQKHLEFTPSPDGTISYTLKDYAGGDAWKNIVVVLNGTRATAAIPVPQGKYKVVLRGMEIEEAGLMTRTVNSIEVPAATAMILVEE
jgi:pullulanase